MSAHHRFVRTVDVTASAAPQADTRPEPSWADTAVAGFRTTLDDIEDVQASRLDDAYQPVVEALRERGVNRSFLRPWYSTAQLPFSDNSFYDRDAIWREIERARATDPSAFREVGSREHFELEVRRRGGERDTDLDTLARGAFVPQLLGSIPAMYRDPVNLATGGFAGAGKGIAAKVLTEGLLQAGVAAAQSGQVAEVRAAMGEEYGLGEAAADIGLAFAGGAVLRGSIEVAPRIDSAAYRATAPLREAIDGKFATRDVARALAEESPAGSLTPDQQAAVNVLTRAEEIEAASPFVDTYLARDAHATKLAEAMEALEEGRLVPAGRASAAARAWESVPAALRSTGVASDFDLRRYLARNRVAESSGDDAAAAATSSAYGRYQFLKDTWVEFYQRTFGKTGESREAILRKRADGAVQDQVMATFTRANIEGLRAAGAPVTDGTVYLAHFLGLGDAVKVLRAADGDALGGLVSRASIRANRGVFENVATVGDLIRWADRKMGSRTAVAGAGREADSAIDDALDIEAALVAVEEARLANDDPLPARFEPELPQLKRELFGSDTEWRIAQAESDATLQGRDPADDLMFRLRAAVADRDRAPSLNQIERLSAELGTTPAALREGLDRLAELGELRRTARGQFTRLPRSRGQRAPEDLVRFVARNGGLAYDGLEQRGRKLGTKGHDLRNTGALARFVPGVGPLLRPQGRSLDDAAELAWEAGYFGPPEVTPRPSENDFLSAMDRATRGERILSSFDAQPDPARVAEEPWERGDLFQSRAHYESERARYDAAANRLFGRSLDEDEFLDAFDRAASLPVDADFFDDPDWWEAGLDLDARLLAMVHRRIDEALDDAFFEAEDALYDVTEQLPEAGAEGRAGGEGREGQAADAGDAGAERARGGARPGDAQDAQLTPAASDAAEAAGIYGPSAPDQSAARAFDSDTGEGVKSAAESDWHDIRAQVEDPGVAARRRQEAQLRADAPLRGENATGQAQDGEMGLALFDTADQPTFDLDDGKGPRTIAEIEADIAADKAGIEAIRGCL